MVNKKIVGIIQARVSSSRLPGKVLMKIEDRTVLEHVYHRSSAAKLMNDVVVATSLENSDNPIEELCAKKGIPCFRGSLNDVLSRYYDCAIAYNATHVMRITADCPIIDPVILDSVITGGIAQNYDCYGIAGNFPDGLDCTLLTINALDIANKNAELLSEREHVTPYIEKNNHRFKCGGLNLFTNLHNKRWTLDEPADLEFIAQIYRSLYPQNNLFSSLDVLDYIEKNPDIELINAGIIRNEGYLQSLKKDK